MIPFGIAVALALVIVVAIVLLAWGLGFESGVSKQIAPDQQVPCVCGGHMVQKMVSDWSQRKVHLYWCSNPRCGNTSATGAEYESISMFLGFNSRHR